MPLGIRHLSLAVAPTFNLPAALMFVNRQSNQIENINLILFFFRFIKEFHLEQEALALQYQANSLIKQVNKFIDGSSADPIDKIGGVGADDEVFTPGATTTTSEVGGIGNLIKSVPTMIGNAAVSVIRSVQQSHLIF